MTENIWYIVVCEDIRVIYYGQLKRNGADIRESAKEKLIRRNKNIGSGPLAIGEIRCPYRQERAITLAEERLFREPGTFRGFKTSEVDLI